MASNSAVGTMLHYFANSGEQCHPAVVCENFEVDGEGNPDTCDLIQLDTITLGAVVPTRRDSVNFDPMASSNGTVHYPCPR